MAALPLVLQIGGAIMAAGAGVAQASAARAEASAAASAAAFNERQAREEAGEQESAFRRDAARELARQRSNLAKSGVALEGTPLDQLVRNANELEQTAVGIRRGLITEAMLARMTGRNALAQGRRASTGALLGGFAQAGGMIAQGYSSGLLRRGA